MKWTKTHWLWALGISVGAGVAWLAIPRGTPVEVVVLTRGALTQTVVMSGRIATVARSELASQGTARIERIAVREGDTVQAGQVLVQLRDDEAQSSMGQANAAVSEAQARIRLLQTIQTPVGEQQLEQARAVDTQARNELARTQQLMQKGFVSQSRVDDATRAAQSSRAAVLAATAQAQGNRSGGAEWVIAQARLDQAQAAQRAAAARLDQLSLRAPADGSVITRSADPGDTAQPGRSLLTLVSGTETRIHASVDEKNLKLLQLGQTASASADAYPDRPFIARLTYIAPAVDAQRGTVDLRLVVDSPPDFLRTDMTVSVEIVTGQVDKALLLPSDALRRDPDGALYALVNRNGVAKRLAVKAGLQGTGTTQIAAGLAEGDHVITSIAAVADGDRVREKATRPPPGNMQPAPGLTN